MQTQCEVTKSMFQRRIHGKEPDSVRGDIGLKSGQEAFSRAGSQCLFCFFAGEYAAKFPTREG